MDNKAFKKLAKEALPLIEQLIVLARQSTKNTGEESIRLSVSSDGYFCLEVGSNKSELIRINADSEPHFNLYEVLEC